MASLVQKTKTALPPTHTRSAKPAQVEPGQSSDVESILNLQHTAGNRAVHRLIETYTGGNKGDFAGAGAKRSGSYRASGGPAGPLGTRNVDGGGSGDEVVTVDGGPETTSGGAPASPTDPAPAPAECRVLSGPTYTPSGAVPVTNSGGRKRAPFSFAAAFTPRTPGTFEVRQFIKWDRAFQTWRGGPPHSGFPSSATSDTWYEDRDTNDKRYGRRSGTYSDPIAGGGDEYTLAGAQNQVNGDTYRGRDAPGGPTAMTGKFNFQLKVVDTGNSDAEKASSSEITIDW